MPTKVDIYRLIQHGFKFQEQGGFIRWHSENLDSHGYEFHLELELDGTEIWKRGDVSFCWMVFDNGGGWRHVHIPDLSQVQTMEGIVQLMQALSAGRCPRKIKTIDEMRDRMKENLPKYDEKWKKYGLKFEFPETI